jgi:hypothetical protein
MVWRPGGVELWVGRGVMGASAIAGRDLKMRDVSHGVS